jgi:hypothetical protein
MNAFSTTSRDLVAALLGKRRHPQDVVVVNSIHSYGHTKRIVLVTPHGAERGELYEVHSLHTLEMLRNGDATPEELELSAHDGEDE